MISKKSLKSILFLAPTLIVLVSFSVILLSFNIVINKYTMSKVSQIISDEFKGYDYIYNGNYEESIPYSEGNNLNNDTGESINELNNENDDFIIPVYFFLLDDNKVILSPDQENEKNEYTIAVNLKKHISKNSVVMNEDGLHKISVGNKTYMLRAKKYIGKYDGNFIINVKDNSREYILVAYANITPMQDLINVLTKILIVLTIIIGLIGVFAIFLVVKSIDNSLKNLKKYISDVGKRREVNISSDIVKYREFEEVVETVKIMSNMIDESERVQKNFFQNASHELRTPLMSIQGYAEGLQYGILNDREKSLGIIVDEANKMSELVTQMLQLSNIDEYEIKKEKIDLYLQINNYINSIKSIAIKNNIDIESYIPKNTYFFGDLKQLESAFLNIMSNAIKYAKSKVGIKVSENDDSITFLIYDDGNGISESDLPHIFERFYKGKNGNFGIGLAITKEIIDRHNGEIKVFSEIEKGTQFLIKFPKEQSN